MRELTTNANIQAPDSDYPFGRVKNNTGSNNGTPVNENLLGDLLQFPQKLMDEAGLTPNNLPDNEYSGFQIFEAFQKYMRTYPYKSYVANLTQSGTAAPSAQVMPGNEIGSIVWARSSTGTYTGTLSGAFSPLSNVTVLGGGVNANGFIWCRKIASTNTVQVITYDPSFNAADDILDETPIEIRVYQ